MDFNRTDGKDKDFIENCRLLEMDLDRRIGKKIKRDKYKKYNQLDEIKEAIVVYEDGKAIGGGAIRRYDDESIELKRVFVHTEYQGRGIGSRLVSLLIEWAMELGYKRMVQAENNGVCCILTGTDRKENKKINDFVKMHDVFGTAGIHPHNADRAKQEDFQLIEQILSENDKMVAVGECGLDYDRIFAVNQ